MGNLYITPNKNNITKKKHKNFAKESYRSKPQYDLNKKPKTETIRRLTEVENEETRKTNLTVNKDDTFSLNTQNVQNLDFKGADGKLSVTSEIKGYTKFEEDGVSVKKTRDLHGSVEAEKHGSGNIKSNIRLIALTSNNRYASDYMTNAAKDEEFDRINGGYVKSVLRQLDTSTEKDINEEINDKLLSGEYDNSDKTELNRLKELNENTINKKEQFKIEVESKVKKLVQSEQTEQKNNSVSDFYFFLYKRKPEEMLEEVIEEAPADDTAEQNIEKPVQA